MSSKVRENRWLPDRGKLKLLSTDTPQTLPYGHNRGSALIIPADYDTMRKKAVKAMFEHAEIQLMPLQEQISFLNSKTENLQLLSGRSENNHDTSVESTLALIDEQKALIRKQVQSIQEKYLISLEILKAKFSFVPVQGEVYYLYQKGVERVLMLVGPHQWQLDDSTLYIATVKLMSDASWQILSVSEEIKIDFGALDQKEQ